MRLTSENICKKLLIAGNCLSEITENMWLAKEEGDTESANCYREKALFLRALMDSIRGWKPTLLAGNKIVITTNVVSGSYSFPWLLGETTTNGKVILGQQYYASTISDSAVWRSILKSYGNAVNNVDDTIQIYGEITSLSPLTQEVTIEYTDEAAPINFDVISTTSGIVTTGTISDPVPFTRELQGCLSNPQVENALMKIDDICMGKC